MATRRFDVMVWIPILVILVTMVHNASARLHYVGGTKSEGWRPDRNYTQWSMNEKFYVGEWLYFGFDKRYYSVLQVNKTSYEHCNTDNPIKIVSRGAGRDVFNLTEPITYYFISGGWGCWRNMKVAIIVENSPSPPIGENSPSPPIGAPLPSANGSSSLKGFTASSLVIIGLSFFLTSFSFLSCINW